MIFSANDLSIARGSVWRIDPGRTVSSGVDVEVTGIEVQNGETVVMTREILPGGFSRPDVRPVRLQDFLEHAVKLCGSMERGDYDKADPRELFVR